MEEMTKVYKDCLAEKQGDCRIARPSPAGFFPVAGTFCGWVGSL